MRGGTVAKLVTFTGSAVLVGGPVVGALYFLLPSTSVSGDGKASNPRFVMARTKVTDPELSFAYDSFFSEGEVVDKPVTFEKANISFDGYKLKEGDILCSPKQDGKFFVLQEISRRNAQLPKYRVMGYSREYIVNIDCNWRNFPSEIRRDESKTIYLKNLDRRGQWGRGGWSGGIDTIYISSCSFVLKNRENGKFDIDWQGCRMDENIRGGNSIPETSLGVSYEIK